MGNVFQNLTRVRDDQFSTDSKPWLTWLVLTVYSVIFISLKFENNPISNVVLYIVNYLSTIAVWQGNYWALFTSTFIHIENWHFIGNSTWIFVLGGLLELELGKFKWILFYFSSAIVSSVSQLAFSDTTGIGASGVLYAMFGFMWITKDIYPRFKTIVTRETSYLLIGWLFIGVFLTARGILNVGNAAHFAGVLFGLAIGAAIRFNLRRSHLILVFTLITLITLVPLFWCPWSANWVSLKGNEYFGAGDYKTAIAYYQRALALGQDPVWVWKNISLAYWSQRDQNGYNTAISTLEQIDKDAAEEIKKELAEAEKSGR